MILNPWGFAKMLSVALIFMLAGDIAGSADSGAGVLYHVIGVSVSVMGFALMQIWFAEKKQ